MSAYAFGAALDVGSVPHITSPPAVKKKGLPASSRSIELDTYTARWNHKVDVITQSGPQAPHEADSNPPTGSQTPKTPNELEMSEPSTPIETEVSRVVPSFSYPQMNRYRVLAVCLVQFGNGMNDASAGALIPYMEEGYHIGYAVVSLIFITNAVGFITAAFFTDLTLSKLGRARALMTSELIMMVGMVIIACTPPFPGVVFAFFFLGLGEALNLALNNVFCANLANATVILGAAHGSYGLGGIVGPIVATALVSRSILWSRFYITTLGIRILCLISTGRTFHNYETEPTSILSGNRQRNQPTKLQMLKRAVNNRATIMGALFIFAYQGSEVSTSGWIISYLITSRNGDPKKVGYVTSGFWGGITLGRFVLSHLGTRIGEKRFVYILTLGAIAFQLLVWFIPNIIGEAVAVSILGVLLGPIYPCATSISSKLLDVRVQMTALSFISSAGSSGGAVAPFMTGLLASAVGTFVLHPICIGLFVVMLGCWFGLPRVVKRTE